MNGLCVDGSPDRLVSLLRLLPCIELGSPLGTWAVLFYRSEVDYEAGCTVPEGYHLTVYRYPGRPSEAESCGQERAICFDSIDRALRFINRYYRMYI